MLAVQVLAGEGAEEMEVVVVDMMGGLVEEVCLRDSVPEVLF